MSKFPTRRLVAATVLAATLAVFALPAAAAPIGAWSYGTWELPTFLSWFDTLWSGMFGGERSLADATGPSSVIQPLKNASDPDGLPAASALPEEGVLSAQRSSDGGLF